MPIFIGFILITCVYFRLSRCLISVTTRIKLMPFWTRLL